MMRWYCRDVVHDGAAQEGDLVAWNYRAWRLHRLEEYERPEDGVTEWRVVLRPADADPNVGKHPGDRHGVMRSRHALDRLKEHYGVCVKCGDLVPCREEMAAREAKQAAERMARYETPGVCPQCQQPVTTRQERETFPNVVVPLGPPVTFHMGRRACKIAADRYRDRVGQPDTQLRLDGGHG